MNTESIDRSKTFRADEGIETSLTRPCEGAPKKGISRLLIILALKIVKLGFLALMVAVEGLVLQNRKASHINPIARGDEEIGLRMLIKGMFPAVKNLAILYQKAGFRNKAVEMWERALSLAPDEPTRHSIKEHLLNLL